MSRPRRGQDWVRAFARAAHTAVQETIDKLTAIDDWDEPGVNTLSAMGNMISASIRRQVLRELLIEHDFRLVDVSNALGMGGASNVTKAAVQLGLSDLLKDAKLRGKAVRGRPKKRTNLRAA